MHKLEGDPITAAKEVAGEDIYKCLSLRGGGQEAGARLFPVVPSDRTRGNGHKLE